MNRIRIHVLPTSRGRLTPVPRPQEPLACAFAPRPCSQPRLEGQEFCIKHILEDRNAPFKQCSYVSTKNGKRCPNAAPKPEKKDGTSFCAEHARRNALALQAQGRKSNPGPVGETLLCQLSSYARAELGTQGTESSRSEASRILDEDSWSDCEQEPVTVEQTWRGDPDSEADSIDSDQEDPLKHAGVYTAEEVALIMREKLIRLQSLYIDQFKRLQHLLKEKKRRFLHSRKGEHEAIGSSLLTGPEGLMAKERENLKRLKCLRRYRQRYGVEALLHRQLRERRVLATDGAAQQAHTTRSSQRCLAFVDDVRCSNPSLPMTRHCLTHICQDTNQTLFKPCQGSEEVPCNKPVPVSLSEEPCCPLHLRLPPQMYIPEQVLAVPQELGAAPTELYLSAAELQPTESLPLEFSDDLDVVGDGMQCPPSPLLFDPSVSLDPSLRDVPEAPIDILALEEPDRGSSSTALVPPAEGPAQVGLQGLPPPPQIPPRWVFPSRKPPPLPLLRLTNPWGSPLGVPMVWVALGVCQGGGGSQRWLSGWLSATLALGVACLGHWGCLPALGTAQSQLREGFRGVVSPSHARGSPFFFLFTGITENCSSPPAWSFSGVSPQGQVIPPTPCAASPVTSAGLRANFWPGGALTEDPRFAVAVGFKQEPRGNISRSVGAPNPMEQPIRVGATLPPGLCPHHNSLSPSCPQQSHLPCQPREQQQQPQETASSTPARGAAANGSLEPGAVS